MKAVVASFNQEKALVGAFSVIVKTGCDTDGSSAALVWCLPGWLMTPVMKISDILHMKNL